jgi:formylglycine-generating enzyme required for sulfatase activity/mono/diheme cytochrome c family protein
MEIRDTKIRRSESGRSFEPQDKLSMNKLIFGPTLLSVAMLTLMASTALPSRPAPQQQTDLAVSAYAVLEKHCAKCHGKDKTGEFTFHDYKSMVDNGHIVPGKPDQSRLFIRAAKSPGDPMPPRSANNPLSADEVATLKAWIEAGAPPLKVVTTEAPHKFLTEADVLTEIKHDLDQANERERPYLRYFTLTHLANAGASDDEMQALRVGLSKLMNSLSWQKNISVPEPIDVGKTILRIDLRRYSWTEQTWKKLLLSYPYAVASESVTAQAIYDTTECPLPYVRADWFVSRAAQPPLYHDLLDMPTSARALEAKLGVDIEKNQKEETALRAGLQESGVSRNNRVVERHESSYGAYWRSYDFRSNSGKQNIFKNPLSFEAAGGEIIFNLPNGLQAYLLVDAKGNRIDSGPIDIVSNKENANDPVVRNGLTCMSCHAQGMKRFSDTLRTVIAATPKGQSDYDHDHALALYVEKPKMNAMVEEDAKRFAAAVRETGAEVTAREPIYALQGRYDSTLDLNQAAADAGLPVATFQSRLQGNVQLGALLGPLKTPGGRLKRDAWEEYFSDVVQEMHLGVYLKSNGVSLIASVIKIKKNARDGADMVYVPAGEFTMGSNEFEAEKPIHRVMLDGYYIYRTPVTVEQYLKFCAETGHRRPPSPDFNRNWTHFDHPIVNVSYDDALDYCHWAGGKLPTEAQWEKAARGTDGSKFPWGNDFDGSKLWRSVNKPGDAGGTKPVGSFPSGASPYGALDMAGNVWQWCSDWYDYYFYTNRLANERNPDNQSVGEKKLRVVSSGSWNDFDPMFFRGATRIFYVPDSRLPIVGFRCVVAIQK